MALFVFGNKFFEAFADEKRVFTGRIRLYSY
jgi:hypothetical protein